MAHEITKHDGLVLTQRRAWHNLGIIVDKAPTPSEARRLAGLDWTATKRPLYRQTDTLELVEVESHRAIVRSDTGATLGVVGKDYQPVQNDELFDFAAALAQEGETCSVESAGSIREGRRVWCLIRGASFDAWNDADPMHTYLLVANGHDGTLAVWCQPTSVRVVCSNTLHYAMNRARAIRFKHQGNISEKIDDARRALGLWRKGTDEYREQVETLAARTMTREDLQRFFLDVYSETERKIPANPTNKLERRHKDEALAAIRHMGRNFDLDREKTGAPANAWSAFNAATEWMQHQRKTRGANDAARRENAMIADMFGTVNTKKQQAFTAALALV